MTNFLQFAINVRKSHRQYYWSLHLLCEDLVLFLRVDFRDSLWGSSIQSTNKKFLPCIQFSFVNFVLNPNPQKYLTYNERQIKKNTLYLGNHS
jgi:hypothetical protein